MDNSGNTSNPSGLTGNRMNLENSGSTGNRPSIHSARPAAVRNSTNGVPKASPGLPRVPSVQIRRPVIAPPASSISSALSMPKAASTPAMAPVPPAMASASTPAIAPVPSPVMPSVSTPAVSPVSTQMPSASSLPDTDNQETCAISMEDNGYVPPTRALDADELAVAGLPFSEEELAAEPEIEAPMTTLPVGMKIDDRYEIQDTLGVGGFATVYRAHHMTIDRDVALKVMDLKKGVDPSYSQRFFREAKIAAKINHNNVVSIYDYGHVAETGQPYIAMEMLHGHDLSHELAEAGPLSPRRMYALFRPVLEALGQGHDLGIVHKDLKPENLYLVDPRGSHELMKVLDFGVARINSNEVAKLTSAGQLLGTPRYLAPEYIKQQLVSPAIDVYQMALIISEALTGIPAVSGDPYHAMMLHCSGKLQIAEFLLDGPVGVVFRKAISIDPEQRYADCNAFGAALDSVVDYFSSEVPLEGGAPQITPESTVGAAFSSGLSSRQNTGEELSNDVLYPTPKKNSTPLIVATVIFLILAIVIFCVIAVKMKNAKEASEAAIPAPVVPVEIKDPEYKFVFNTEPSGAEVKLNGVVSICESTPCEKIYKKSDLGMPVNIQFKLDGYDSVFHTICIEGQNDTGCEYKHEEDENSVLDVNVEMAKSKATEVKLKITYTPTDAVVKNRHGRVICQSSPCERVMTQADGFDEFSISHKNTKLYAPTAKVVFEDALQAIEKDNLDGYPVKFAMIERKAKPAAEKKTETKEVQKETVIVVQPAPVKEKTKPVF